jgi:hypothetical protein
VAGGIGFFVRLGGSGPIGETSPEWRRRGG